MSDPSRTVSATPSRLTGEGDALGFYSWSGQTYRVPGDRERILVGRKDSDATRLDIELPDTEVSSMHCIIERRRGGQFVLHDCSKNGSLVNGAQVNRSAVGFRSGDTVQLGQTKLVVLRQNGPDFGPGPHDDEVIRAAFRFYQTLRATADGLSGVSFHRVRTVITQR